MRARRLAIAVGFAALAACTWKGASKPAATAAGPPAAPPSYEMRLGHEVFVHYCATCHGDAGAGDGFNAYNLDPRPRDLSDPTLQKKSDAEISDAIRHGGSGVGLSSLMPPWGRTLTEGQIDEVLLYVRGLKKSPS